jgi:hypothetical protein
LAFDNSQHIWVVHWDLKAMIIAFATKDVFVVIESSMENQCKDKSLELSLSTFFFFCNFLFSKTRVQIFWIENYNMVFTIFSFHFFFVFNIISWFCGCFGKGYINFDSRIGNKVPNPWCHGCFWNCISPILAALIRWNVFLKTFLND